MLDAMASQLTDMLRSRLCSSLTVQEAERIADATVPRKVLAGAPICAEGDRNAGLIFLTRGSGEIVRGTPPPGSPPIAAVEGPTMLGEVSLLTNQPASATVRARTDCECYVLTRSQFQRLLENESRAISKLVIAIAEGLARKLTAMNDRVAQRS
jgi:CRP-like cAMP-binding protein